MPAHRESASEDTAPHDPPSPSTHQADNRAVADRAESSGFIRNVQVYEPHRVGLPPVVPYVTELWRRREFAAHLSRSNMRAANTRTFFGQLWLVINPLLLALVYYVMVSIISSRQGGMPFLAHLTAGIFIYYFVSGSISTGATSVTAGGSLIANMAFPRLLMPLSAVRTAFFRFLPTIPVYLVIHTVAGLPWSWVQLLALYFLACTVLFAAGLAAVFATFQVYFRDTTAFLPYALRIGLYLSPVLWFIEQVPGRLQAFVMANPLYYLIGGWTDLLVRAKAPEPVVWVGAAVIAVVTLVAGSMFFMSREREFAVRL